MVTIVRRNERSWAIELISKINKIAYENDIAVKKAGGENTISVGRNKMFPDIILYGNEEQSVILQGWELKMPDVSIEDNAFIKDAQRKADALGLNSCMIWNFSYAVFYVRDNEKSLFRMEKQWSETSYIKTRDDVQIHRDAWKKLLEKVILELNQYFIADKFRKSILGDVISNTTIATLLERNKLMLAETLKVSSFKDSIMACFIDDWWNEIKIEYENDESDKYSAYAKTIILNWINRVLFAHLIKSRQNGAMIINNLDYNSAPADANQIFKEITKKCDFYNVFTEVQYDEILSELTWMDIVELSIFLRENGIEQLDQVALQNILENSVDTVKREINGQYTTPPELARILARLSVRDWSDNFLDCCCGTGTIPKKVIEIKKSMFDIKEAVETVWACDKYQFPLQIANISMAGSDTIHLANRIFQHNALSLMSGEKIYITDPETGNKIELRVPEFGSVATNLPFVPFEVISNDDKDEITKIPYAEELDGRSDLYCYIALAISKVLKKEGLLAIITSNSWLGTLAGRKMLDTMKNTYELLQVHISGRGKWFNNANVVATIMVWKKRGGKIKDTTQFFLWKKALEEFECCIEDEDKLINSALLGKETDCEIAKISEYVSKDIEKLCGLNISYNALFHNVNWLLDISNKAVTIDTVFNVLRGSRRGWDALFYPKAGEHCIEKEFLRKICINARHVSRLSTVAESDAFCCNLSIDELKSKGYIGTIEWIEKFVNQKNGVGKPLPQVLSKKGMQWYELQDKEIAEIFTMMNPDKRLFFSKFETPSFVNQRLIGLRHKPQYSDELLNHALLNSMFTMFYIEAAGFGRGLGVLDINKSSIQHCYMLNPKSVKVTDRKKILDAFQPLLERDVKNVADELFEADRVKFEHVLLSCYGINQYFDQIRESLLSMQKTRATAKENIVVQQANSKVSYFKTRENSVKIAEDAEYTFD